MPWKAAEALHLAPSVKGAKNGVNLELQRYWMCGLSIFRPSSQRGSATPPAALLTFANDEATLVSGHSVGHLLDAPRGPQAPVAAAAASASGYRQASKAVSFLGRKRSSSDISDTASSTSFPLWGGS